MSALPPAGPRRRPDAQREEVPGTGECVLLDAKRSRVLALNPAGAAVWELLDGQRDVPALGAILAAAAGIPPAQAEAEVRALLERLAAEGFLLDAPAAEAPRDPPRDPPARG